LFHTVAEYEHYRTVASRNRRAAASRVNLMGIVVLKGKALELAQEEAREKALEAANEAQDQVYRAVMTDGMDAALEPLRQKAQDAAREKANEVYHRVYDEAMEAAQKYAAESSPETA